MGRVEDNTDSKTLVDNEVKLLSQIVRTAYSDTLATDTWTRVLDMIGGLVPYDAGGAVFANVQTGRLENRVFSKPHKAHEELLQWYDAHYCALDMIASVALARELSVWRPSDVIGRQEWEESKIRNSLRDGFGLGEQICITCGSATEISARCWLLRDCGKIDFSERDRFVLGLLQPHFCTALSLAKDRLEGDIYRESFQQVMRPGAICDSSGKIMKINEGVRQLAGEGDGKDNGFLAQLEAVAQDMVARKAHWGSATLDGHKCRLSVHAVQSQNAPTSYVVTVFTAKSLRNTLYQFTLDYGLSERECEVCMMLVHGASNHEVAEKLFIAEVTVKDHVTSILQKLGITRRGAIVPKLLGI